MAVASSCQTLEQAYTLHLLLYYTQIQSKKEIILVWLDGR